MHEDDQRAGCLADEKIETFALSVTVGDIN
jgi:hypothetical protein